MDFDQQNQRQASGQTASAVQDQEDELFDAPQASRRSGRSEAGRKGGEATRKKMGSDFYRTIGRKGGQARRQRP